MALQPGIILGGEPLNVLGAMAMGTQQAQNEMAFRDQANLRNLYRSQGDLIASGDQQALNALAKLSPDASLAVQDARLGMDQTRLQMDATRQDMQFSAEKMAMLREQTKREAAAALQAQAATLSAEQLAAEQQALSEALSGGAFFYQNKDKAGYDAFLASKGLDPAEFPFEAFPAHAATVEGVLEAMKTFAPPEAPEWREATPEEAARYGAKGGQINTKTGKFERTPMDKGTIIETMPDGTTRITEAPGLGQGTDGTTVGQVYNPNEIESVVGLIDQIDTDPNLGGVLGNKALIFGGGNMISEMNLAQRAAYGTKGLAVIEKIGQLQSNAWLSARAMLKGGGAITDYESKKAEAAVARLERPKDEADFRAALKELRDAITEGERKLREAQGGGQPAQANPADMSDEEYLKMLGLE